MAYETLHDRLRGPIATTLKKELDIQNVHALPQIDKVVINVGINKSKMDSKEMRAYIEESLMRIAGQKPVFTKARLSISNFKVREGMITGAMVTLRGPRMEEFLDRLISYVLPRIRDFRGLKAKLDGQGNYNIGIKDHSIFPEVPPADARQIFGLQITISTTTDNDTEALALLKQMGVPFKPEKTAEEKEAEAKKAEAAEAKAAAEAEEKAEAPKTEEAKAEDAPAEEAPAEEEKKDDTPEAEEAKDAPESDTES